MPMGGCLQYPGFSLSNRVAFEWYCFAKRIGKERRLCINAAQENN